MHVIVVIIIHNEKLMNHILLNIISFLFLLLNLLLNSFKEVERVFSKEKFIWKEVKNWLMIINYHSHW